MSSDSQELHEESGVGQNRVGWGLFGLCGSGTGVAIITVAVDSPESDGSVMAFIVGILMIIAAVVLIVGATSPDAARNYIAKLMAYHANRYGTLEIKHDALEDKYKNLTIAYNKLAAETAAYRDARDAALIRFDDAIIQQALAYETGTIPDNRTPKS